MVLTSSVTIACWDSGSASWWVLWWPYLWLPWLHVKGCPTSNPPRRNRSKNKRTPYHSLESAGMRLQLAGLAPARSGDL